MKNRPVKCIFSVFYEVLFVTPKCAHLFNKHLFHCKHVSQCFLPWRNQTCYQKLLFVLALSLSYIFIIPRFPVVLPSLWSFCDKVLDHPTSHMRGHSLFPLCRDCGPLNAADSAFLYCCPALCFLALNPPSLTLFFCLSINFSHQDAKFAPLPSHHKLLQPLHSRLNSDEWIFPALIIRRSSGRALLPAAVFISYWEADLKQISGRMTRMLREAVREHRIWERKEEDDNKDRMQWKLAALLLHLQDRYSLYTVLWI